jgi:hypothetical protein
MNAILLILRNSFVQFWALFGIFFLGGALLTYLSRWTNNALRQFVFPNFGTYAFGFIGIPVHEFSHAFFCKLFLHEVKKVKWFDAKAKGGSHGSVEHHYNPWNLYHRMGHVFIGLGPAILGPVLLAILFYILVPSGRSLFSATLPVSLDHSVPMVAELLRAMINRVTLTQPKFYFFLYLAICISSQIELSPEDLKQVATGIIPLLFVLLLVNILAWAMGGGWHVKALAIGAHLFAVGGCVFIFAAVLRAINLVLCTSLLGIVNIVSGRDTINPFRTP